MHQKIANMQKYKKKIIWIQVVTFDPLSFKLSDRLVPGAQDSGKDIILHSKIIIIITILKIY